MFVFSLAALGVVALIAALAICSGHIPRLRDWTGAAPLQPEAPSLAEDFAASRAAGYITDPDWGTTPASTRPATVELKEEAE